MPTGYLFTISAIILSTLRFTPLNYKENPKAPSFHPVFCPPESRCKDTAFFRLTLKFREDSRNFAKKNLKKVATFV